MREYMTFPRQEYILCAAIWYDDGKVNQARRSYSLPETGFVLCGYRHPDIIANLPTNNKFRNDGVEYKTTQGFLTSKGRFVDRSEAYRIAAKSRQIDSTNTISRDQLYSEDLY